MEAQKKDPILSQVCKYIVRVSGQTKSSSPPPADSLLGRALQYVTTCCYLMRE